jgi:hypothetical protein
MLFFLFLFFSLTTTQRMLFASSPHAHTHTPHRTTHTTQKKHNTTMATHRPITPSSISPPTHGRSPSNLFYSLLNIPTHHPMRRQLQCHSRLHVRSRRPTRTRKFTNPSTPDLVEFAVKPFHLQFERNHFPSLSNN